MASVGVMIKTIKGLLGTKDITDWEENFIEDISEKTQDGRNTTTLTEKQVESVERIYQKHYGY